MKLLLFFYCVSPIKNFFQIFRVVFKIGRKQCFVMKSFKNRVFYGFSSKLNRNELPIETSIEISCNQHIFRDIIQNNIENFS